MLFWCIYRYKIRRFAQLTIRAGQSGNARKTYIPPAAGTVRLLVTVVAFSTHVSTMPSTSRTLTANHTCRLSQTGPLLCVHSHTGLVPVVAHHHWETNK